MTSRIVWLALKQLRKVWVRVVAYAALAFATLALAQPFSTFVPPRWAAQIGTEAVDQVLSIMASSMLAVTTFSLSVAVSAFAAAAQATTPRATALLEQDPTTQNVLATFLGAFLFSLLGLVALNAGLYSENGQFVLFLATTLVIGLVVLAFLRWIAHLMSFGRMEDTLDRVEAAAWDAFSRRQSRPCLGGAAQSESAPESGTPVQSTETGYIQHVDVQNLADVANRSGAHLWLCAVPGTFVHTGAVLAICEGGQIDMDAEDAIRAAFTCARSRTFDQDPRFGLVVMSEIASRALSPGINDPGTAIEVIGRLVRILGLWRSESPDEVEFPDVLVAPIETMSLLQNAFRPIARDGAGFFEVQLRLQKALAALARTDPGTFSSAAESLSQEAMARARDAGLHPDELEHLEKAAPSNSGPAG